VDQALLGPGTDPDPRLYVLIGRRDRIGGKAIGTAVGAASAIPIAIIAPPTWAIALIAAAAFVLAVMQTKTYWLMYGLYTFGLVLVLAPPGQVASEAEQRGVQILTGIAPSRGRSGHRPRCGQVAGQALPATRTRPCGLRNVGLGQVRDWSTTRADPGLCALLT
jgi:Fusaric acid resistance protein-like